jgi:molecular chaperone GrpE
MKDERDNTHKNIANLVEYDEPTATTVNECIEDEGPSEMGADSQPKVNESSCIDTTATHDSTTLDEENAVTIESLARLESSVDQIKALIAKRLSFDKTKEKAFERLYVDLDNQREDRIFSLVRPICFDLILLHDRLVNALRDKEEAIVDSEFMVSVIEELIEILARQGVDIINSTSEIFDPSQQQAIGIDVAMTPVDHNRVSSVVRKGFRHGSRVIRAEEVTILSYDAGGSSTK